VIQETDALSLGHFATRALMVEAAATVGLDPDRLSSLRCFQILKCRLPECHGSSPEQLEQWYRGLLWEMQTERADDAVRRDRINPRVIKRKMSQWKKKRSQHRHLPVLDENLKKDSRDASLNGIDANGSAFPRSSFHVKRTESNVAR
jgi:hypothetical protein